MKRFIPGLDHEGNNILGQATKDIVATEVITLLTATTEANGTSVNMESPHRSFQANSDASHSGSSTIKIQGSLDDTNWIDLLTLTVTDASDTAGDVINAPWLYVRAICSSHADDTNTVTVYMGG